MRSEKEVRQYKKMLGLLIKLGKSEGDPCNDLKGEMAVIDWVLGEYCDPPDFNNLEKMEKLAKKIKDHA